MIVASFREKLIHLNSERHEKAQIGRIYLKAMLFWALTTSPIENVEEAYNYAWISMLPLEYFAEAYLPPVDPSEKELKCFIAAVVSTSRSLFQTKF